MDRTFGVITVADSELANNLAEYMFTNKFTQKERIKKYIRGVEFRFITNKFQPKRFYKFCVGLVRPQRKWYIQQHPEVTMESFTQEVIEEAARIVYNRMVSVSIANIEIVALNLREDKEEEK